MSIRVLVSMLCGLALRGADMAPLSNFLKAPEGLKITAAAEPRHPWTVAGEHAALFGRQNGKFEAWLWPNKILSNFAIRAEMADYAVPIDVNALAAEITVTPAETIITYSHAAFTIRQHVFAARGANKPAVGAAVVFEIDAARTLELTFSFTPEMLRMWPAPNFGRPNGEWVGKSGDGVYVLHTDDPEYAGLVAMPHTRPGIQVPYQEHPQTYPLELKLSFNPKRDKGLVYPLVYGMTDTKDPMAAASGLVVGVQKLYGETRTYYQRFLAEHLAADTPDMRLNEALAWAEVAIDQTQVEYHGETGMVAGYYESADSARPGYAWFFGRDTLWTTYAINSYGDGALTRRALDFILKRQRDDGKIMHEYSQSADALDWKTTPYFYASADAAPLLVMAMCDYVKVSGDVAYLRANWEAVKKAYAFSRAHESADGITNNTQGTGWVESWPTGMPYQEIYLAAIDGEASLAMARLAALMSDGELAGKATAKARDIEAKIPAEYFNQADRFYAFSRNQDGTRDETASIYPAVAWWDGTMRLPKAGEMLGRWASEEFSADWGTRDISNRTSIYDPISYHQGSIWPLFTGWVALAEYREGRTLSGFAHLMQNVNLTWEQDLGSVTELLSGDYYQPLGRSSSHQMWSSAMIVTPLLRGMFGLEWDAPRKTLRLTPKLPASWDHARLLRVPLGGRTVDLNFERKGGGWMVEATGSNGDGFCLKTANDDTACDTKPKGRTTIQTAAKPVEIMIPAVVPEQGARTSQIKVIEEDGEGMFVLAAPGGTKAKLPVRMNRTGLRVEGGRILGAVVEVEFPEGDGYQRRKVIFR